MCSCTSAWTPDGRLLAADNNVVTRLHPAQPFSSGRPARIVVFSRDGRFVAYSDADGLLHICSTETGVGTCVHLGLRLSAGDMCWDSNGIFVFTHDRELHALLIDSNGVVVSGAKAVRKFNHAVSEPAISPCGTRVSVTHHIRARHRRNTPVDETLIFNIRAIGNKLHFLRQYIRITNCQGAAWSPDGTMVAAIRTPLRTTVTLFRITPNTLWWHHPKTSFVSLDQARKTIFGIMGSLPMSKIYWSPDSSLLAFQLNRSSRPWAWSTERITPSDVVVTTLQGELQRFYVCEAVVGWLDKSRLVCKSASEVGRTDWWISYVHTATALHDKMSVIRPCVWKTFGERITSYVVACVGPRIMHFVACPSTALVGFYVLTRRWTRQLHPYFCPVFRARIFVVLCCIARSPCMPWELWLEVFEFMFRRC